MPFPSPTPGDTFARLENKTFRIDEELRYDIPTSLVSTSMYIGLSGLGTATSEANWAIMKTDFDSNGQPIRKQIKLSIAWDNRVTGPWQ